MKIMFLGDVFCENAASLRCWPHELHADACVFNFEYVHDNGVLAGTDAAEGKINLKGTGNPFLPGFDRYVACLANNHALDYTDAGVESTLGFIRSKGADVIGLTHLEKGPNASFVTVGDGVTVSAYLQRHLLTNVEQGNKWRQVALDESKMLQDAQAAHNAGGRFHVAFLHWGTELLSKPWPNQVELAHRLIDSGLVQMVVGMHSHCIQSYEIYRGRYIFYGLGNCVFPDYNYMASEFKDGASCLMCAERWSDDSRRSIGVVMDSNVENVKVVAVSYGKNGMLKVSDPPLPEENPKITVSDCDKAVWRRLGIAGRLLMAGMPKLGFSHMASAFKSRRTYHAFFNEESRK